jgi:hypothetical protein
MFNMLDEASKRWLGKRFALWQTEYRNDAYRDQFGIPHQGKVVLAQVIATVVEVKEVPGLYRPEETHAGLRAIDYAGTSYTCNWKHFDDATYGSALSWWESVEADPKIWFNAVDEQACTPCVSANGERAVPAGFQICPGHAGRMFNAHNGEECPMCYLAKKLAEQKTTEK